MSCDVQVFTWARVQQLLVLEQCYHQFYQCVTMCNVSVFTWVRIQHLPSSTTQSCQCVAKCDVLVFTWVKGTASAKQHYPVQPMCCYVWCFSVYLDKDTAAAKQHYRVLLCIGVLSSLTHGWWDIKKRFPFLSGHDAVGNIRTVKFASNGLYCYCVYFCVSVCGRACLCVIFRPVFCLYFL